MDEILKTLKLYEEIAENQTTVQRLFNDLKVSGQLDYIETVMRPPVVSQYDISQLKLAKSLEKQFPNLTHLGELQFAYDYGIISGYDDVIKKTCTPYLNAMNDLKNNPDGLHLLINRFTHRLQSLEYFLKLKKHLHQLKAHHRQCQK